MRAIGNIPISWILLVFFGGVLPSGPVLGAAPEFDKVVAPLLARRCLSCHSGPEPKGGLNLSQSESAMAGGEGGAAILAGKPKDSLLWQRVAESEMPPEHPLSDVETKIVHDWIAAGAPWGADPIDPFQVTTESRAGYDWWALQPLRRPEVPLVSDPGWAINPIDAFVLAKLERATLYPSPPASERVLLRRVFYDLCGLPPTLDDLRNVAATASAQRYEQVVDRLLGSPHYGERWARHWLDVVRFGESHGFEYNQPRDNAWHYRNWIIAALNGDMPYDRFVRWQLAGDVLHPDNASAVAATGFLVAGPHNTTKPSSNKMQMTMRQDELEDVVGTIGQTFLGLTINCARCHDHKFDPISQTEYYQLVAAVSGIDHGERPLPDAAVSRARARIPELKKKLDRFRQQRRDIDQMARARVLADRKTGVVPAPTPPVPVASWDFASGLEDTVGSLHGEPIAGARLNSEGLVVDGESYVQSEPLGFDLADKTLEAWVRLDGLEQRGGGVVSVQTKDGATFDAIVYAEREPRRWMAGSEGFRRTESLQGSEEIEAAEDFVHVALVYRRDGTIIGYRNGQPYGQPYKSQGLMQFKAGETVVVFGMRHSPPGSNKMLRGTIRRANLYDRALSADEIAVAASADGDYVSPLELTSYLSVEQRKQRGHIGEQIASLEERVKQIESQEPANVYAAVSREPPVTKVLLRGDVASPGEEVLPAGVKAVPGVSPSFGLSADAADAERRIELARWITHRHNGLFARVIVNRIWHYHFGQGLVSTPSDFGFNGARPSHPQLLDWLATELVRSDWSLKRLHRLIVTSATYRQSSFVNPAAMRIDADNRLLWRMSPRRLEAEEIRDSMLSISSRLNPQLGGEGYRDVREYKYRGSHYYDPVVADGPQAYRRTIYRFCPRGAQRTILDTFDCPDPSAKAPARAVTITPLQALSLLNNRFVLEMADEFAERLADEFDDSGSQVRLAYELTYGRVPEVDESKSAVEFVRRQGLAAFCRVILNSNEFLYVR